MNIQSRHGLPFTEVMLLHKGKSVLLKNFLIDTGSTSTLISADVATKLDLEPKSNDIITKSRGVGRVEYV